MRLGFQRKRAGDDPVLPKIGQPAALPANLARLGGGGPGDDSLLITGLLAAPFRHEPALLVARAAGLVAEARTSEALIVYEQALAADPACVEALFRIGILRQEAGEIPAALDAWARAVFADPTQWIAWLRRGVALAGLNCRVMAASCLEQAMRHVPVLTDVPVQAALVYGELGWWDAARAALARLPEQVPGWWEQVRRRTHDRCAEHERKAEAFEAAASRGAGLGAVRRADHARTLLALGRLEDCERVLRLLLEDRPQDLGAHLARAALALRVSGAEQAVAYLRGLPATVQAEEGFVPALAAMLQEAGDFDAVAALLRPGTPESFPGSFPESFRARAISGLASGDQAVLRETVQAWLAASPDGWAYRFGIAAARRQGVVIRLHGAYPPARRRDGVLPIVQFWGTHPAPPDVAATIASWAQKNPDVPHLVFDADSARTLIAESCSADILEAFDAARHPAMQSDIFRLAYLAHRGGIYVDADELCRRPLDDIQDAMRHVSFVAGLSLETPPYVHNSFLAAEAGCPVILAALDEMVSALASHRAAGTTPDIWQVTGPGLITRCVGRFVSQPGNGGQTLLLSDQEYSAFAGTVDLAYKETAEGNWRLH